MYLIRENKKPKPRKSASEKQHLTREGKKKEIQKSRGDSSANNQSNDSTIEESSMTKGEEVLKEEPGRLPEKGRKRKASSPGNSDVAFPRRLQDH